MKIMNNVAMHKDFLRIFRNFLQFMNHKKCNYLYYRTFIYDLLRFIFSISLFCLIEQETKKTIICSKERHGDFFEQEKQ